MSRFNIGLHKRLGQSGVSSDKDVANKVSNITFTSVNNGKSNYERSTMHSKYEINRDTEGTNTFNGGQRTSQTTIDRMGEQSLSAVQEEEITALLDQVNMSNTLAGLGANDSLVI